MNDLALLLAELEAEGVHVERRGDRLRVRAVARPSDELLDRLREVKHSLMEVLPDADAATRAVVHFRLHGGPPNSWATCIGPGTPSQVEAGLRERFGARLAEIRPAGKPSPGEQST